MNERALGFVGVGRMGGRMCRRLLQAGYTLTVFDTSDEAVRELTELGARRADSPAAVASAAEIVNCKSNLYAFIRYCFAGQFDGNRKCR